MTKYLCPLCNAEKSRPFLKAKKTSYFQCISCKLVFAKKLPRTDYEKYDLDHFVKWEDYLKNIFQKQIKGIKRHKPKGKVLEIGTGMGYMMEMLKIQGYQVEGIEPSQSLVDLSLKKKLKVKKGYFEKTPLKENYYDVIILNHVLEHIQKPNLFLKKIKRIKKKNGILFIQVPNIGSYEARILKSHWPTLVPNDHYLQFTHQTLKEILIQNKFEIIEAKTTGAISEMDDFKKELARCFRNDPKRLVYYIINFIPAVIQGQFNQGSALWYIAR